MKFAIETYGCQMNVADTERMTRLLESAGHVRTEAFAEAEILLLNTCTVRDNADQRVYGRIGQFKQLKDEGRLKILGVCGCLAQSDGQRLIQRSPHVDFVVGTRAFHEIPGIIRRVAGGETHQVRTEMQTRPIELWDREDMTPRFDGPAEYPAFISIMRGCNKNCSFCIVPKVRGREEHRPLESVLREARARAEAGYREVTLIGQNVNAWRDESLDLGFAGLLRAVDAVPGLRRLRFATNHPRHFTDDVIDALADGETLCEHVHLPVQSGADTVLRRMARGYTADRYRGIVERLRNRVPGLSLTTDLIVGFPGESEAEFAMTLALAEEMRWDSAFMFAYSPRRGTRAAELADQAPEAVKKERLGRLIEVVNRTALEANQAYVGRVVEAMVERVTPRIVAGSGIEGAEPGDAAPRPDAGVETMEYAEPRVQARTRSHKVVILEGSGYAPGDFVDVHIREARPYTLFGADVTRMRARQPAATGQ